MTDVWAFGEGDIPFEEVGHRAAGASPEGRAEARSAFLDNRGGNLSPEDITAKRRKRILQAAVREILAGTPPARCGLYVGGSVMVRSERVVEIALDARGSGMTRGVCTCSSAWVCPHCSGVLARERRDMVGGLVSYWWCHQGPVVLMTNTQGTVTGQTLKERIRAMQDRWSECRGGKLAKELERDGLAGGLTAREVMFGGVNKFHPHLHHLLFFRKGVEDASVRSVCERIIQRWMTRCEAVGVPVNRRAQDWLYCHESEKAGEYVTKYGVEWEFTGAQFKAGRGKNSRGLWQVLADFAMYRRAADADLVQTFYNAVRGTKQFTPWGALLREAYRKFGSESDRVVAERGESRARCVAVVLGTTFYEVQERGLWDEVIEAAEWSGMDGVRAYLANLGLAGVLPPQSAQRSWETRDELRAFSQRKKQR